MPRRLPTPACVFALVLVLALSVPGSAPAAEIGRPSSPAWWIALRALEPATLRSLSGHLDLRGTYGDVTLAAGGPAELAELQRVDPGAFVLGERREGERLFVVTTAPGAELAIPPGARRLHRSELLAFIGAPAGDSDIARALAGQAPAGLFHGGLAVVPDRPSRPAPGRPVRWAEAPAHDSAIQGWVDAVDELALRSDVTALSTLFETRRSDTQGGRDAQEWLFDRFVALGLPTEVHDFDGNADNVLAQIPGSIEPEKVVIVGAHYDSTTFSGPAAPGADDNASGTAALLEIARVLTEEGASFRYTLRFVAFASEEFGLFGSDAYSALLRSQGVEVVAMLNTDMNAYRAAGDTLDLDMVTDNATEWLTDLVQEIAHVYLPALPTREGRLSGGTSDHQPFYQDGYPAVFFFEDTGSYSPYIHTGNDVVDLSANDFELSRAIVQAVLASAAVLAEPVDPIPAPVLVVAGACPGTVTIEVSGASPGGDLLLLSSPAEGTFYVPTGTCAGTRLDLEGPRLLATLGADGDGSFAVTREVPAGACGRFLQVLDRTRCSRTEVAALP